MSKSCKCEICQSACRNKPGWYKPDQVKKVMEYFEVKHIKDLLGKDKFAIDWWVEKEGDILVLAPNIKGNDWIEYPNWPTGECVFFTGGLCTIHEIKPFECADYIHNEVGKENRHKEISELWKNENMLNPLF